MKIFKNAGLQSFLTEDLIDPLNAYFKIFAQIFAKHRKKYILSKILFLNIFWKLQIYH